MAAANPATRRRSRSNAAIAFSGPPPSMISGWSSPTTRITTEDITTEAFFHRLCHRLRLRLYGTSDPADIHGMLALSIRQPYAELILRGIKTVEYRSRPTRIIGQRFHI